MLSIVYKLRHRMQKGKFAMINPSKYSNLWSIFFSFFKRSTQFCTIYSFKFCEKALWHVNSGNVSIKRDVNIFIVVCFVRYLIGYSLPIPGINVFKKQVWMFASKPCGRAWIQLLYRGCVALVRHYNRNQGLKQRISRKNNTNLLP